MHHTVISLRFRPRPLCPCGTFEAPARRQVRGLGRRYKPGPGSAFAGEPMFFWIGESGFPCTPSNTNKTVLAHVRLKASNGSSPRLKQDQRKERASAAGNVRSDPSPAALQDGGPARHLAISRGLASIRDRARVKTRKTQALKQQEADLVSLGNVEPST